MITAISRSRLSPLERGLSAMTRIEPGEGKLVGLFALNGFALLLAIYLLKPVRDALILADGAAEVRSYAGAAIALVLLLVMPGYGALVRRFGKAVASRCSTLALVFGLVLFSLGHAAGIGIGFAFFVWVGVVGVLVIAQFWALATDLHSTESGARLLPVVAVGASLGAWFGALTATHSLRAVGPDGTMLVAGGLLSLTTLLVDLARRAAPRPERRASSGAPTAKSSVGGFGAVLRNPYLALIAVSVVLFNWINGTGNFVLANAILGQADAMREAGATAGRTELIGALYSRFYTWVNLLGFVLQVLIVSRLLRGIGAGAAALVVPVIMAVGYTLIACLPIFSVVHTIKTLEEGCSHSIQSTTRHALFLPLDREASFEGKTIIDTIFWRLGDLIQAGAIYAGSTWLGFEAKHFVVFNVVLALGLILVVVAIARKHARLTRASGSSRDAEGPRPHSRRCVQALASGDDQGQPGQDQEGGLGFRDDRDLREQRTWT